jgi:alpha-mannosidase
MKRLIFILACGLLPILAAAQSPVDRAVRTLDSLSRGSLDAWKYRTAISMDASEITELSDPKYDDSLWKTLELNQSISVDSCWLRKKILLPKILAGVPLQGLIRFLVSVDDYGYLWVNGRNFGHFPWDGEFDIPGDFKPGTEVVFLIKAINTGGPLRLLRAEFVTDRSKDIRNVVDELCLSLRVGQKLLGFDTYQSNARVRIDPGIDRSVMDRAEKERLNNLLQSLAAKIDTKALESGQTDRFLASAAAVRKELKPVAEYAKRFTLYFDSNAHIDAAWLWRKKETVEVARRTFSAVLNMMNKRPGFTYSQSQAAMYEWMEAQYPDLFRKIQERVRDGRWETVGGMWVEPDCNLPSGESWSHHLLYGQTYFREKFGRIVGIGWNPDSFGYNWNMPQFFQNAGIDAFITQKIGWNDTNVFPYRVFWWEGPDRSRILAYFPFDYVETVDNPFKLVDWMRQFEANTGFTKLLVLFGVGDHGGGPSLEMLDRIDKLSLITVFPSIEHGTATNYLNWLKGQNLGGLPVWNDELYLEYHRGTYTTQASTKKWNRACETLLTSAEKFSAIATLFDRPYNREDMRTAWKKVLFNQFHDILPGSGIREVYMDADQTYREAAEIGKHELGSSLETLSRIVDTKTLPEGVPILVFNPLGWERTDLVTVPLSEAETGDWTVCDAGGKVIPSQTVVRDRYRREILFVAPNVPAAGYAGFVLKKGKTPPPFSGLTVSSTSLESGFFRIEIDTLSGWVTRITDKKAGREILIGPGNRLQLLEDKPTAWDAWNIGLTGKEYPSRFDGAEIIETGPVRATIRLQRSFLKPGVVKEFPTEDFPTSFFTQDVTLVDGLDRIFFTTGVEWWEEKTMLKVAFPFTLFDSTATFEIPYGSIQRSTTRTRTLDRGKWEVSAQRWADLSSGGYGISLLNNSKYGHDITKNVLRLSLLRSPKWPDPTADQGNHSIDYALYPHAGDWKNGTVRRGYEFNTPLVPVRTDRHKGKLPIRQSFIRLEPANLVLATVKQTEQDPACWVIQWYDANGQAVDAVLTLPETPRTAVLSDFLEQDGNPLPIEGTNIRVSTPAHSVVTVKVGF